MQLEDIHAMAAGLPFPDIKMSWFDTSNLANFSNIATKEIKSLTFTYHFLSPTYV